MNAWQRLHKRLITGSSVAALLVAAVCTGLGAGQALADNSPEAAAEWDKAFGGSLDDSGCSVQQTLDQGFIIAGITGSYGSGNTDVYLVKTGSDGEESWHVTFGGSAADEGWSVQQTLDGGYIIAGCTNSYGAGGYDVWLIKTDSSGVKSWDATFGGVEWDHGYAVRQTADGGYIIAGDTYSQGSGSSDVYLIKSSSTGNLEWEKTFGGSGVDIGYAVQQTADGGYIVTGATYSEGAGSSDVYLMKVDSSGILEWEKTHGGLDLDMGYAVQQTSDGGYVVGGRTYSYGAGDYDVWLVKTDSGGSRQWAKTFGGPGADLGRSVRQTSDGGYVIAGETSSYGSGGPDAWVIVTDSGGIMQWSQTFGGPGPDFGRSVGQRLDGGYIVAGATSSYGAGDSDAWLISISRPPYRPTNMLPSGGATEVSPSGTLQSSSFSDPDSGDTHGASQWQVTAVAGDYSSPMFDSGTDTVNKLSVAVPSGALDYDSTYYWRVRHQDGHGSWSDYSSETSFSTVGLPPNQPDNITPADGATAVGVTPTLTCVVFIDPNVGDTHAASRWQISRASGNDFEDSIVFDSGTDDVHLLSIKVPSENLQYENTYYWRVRHEDNNGDRSAWSAETSFATGAQPAAPEADFTAQLAAGEGLTVHFTSTSGGVIDSWAWDFDNDGTWDSTVENPSCSYSGEGTFSVVLRVTGPGGTDTQTKEITVGGGGAGACACASVGAAPPVTELMVGWTITGFGWGTGYWVLRRRVKPRRR